MSIPTTLLALVLIGLSSIRHDMPTTSRGSRFAVTFHMVPYSTVMEVSDVAIHSSAGDQALRFSKPRLDPDGHSTYYSARTDAITVGTQSTTASLGFRQYVWLTYPADSTERSIVRGQMLGGINLPMSAYSITVNDHATQRVLETVYGNVWSTRTMAQVRPLDTAGTVNIDLSRFAGRTIYLRIAMAGQGSYIRQGRSYVTVDTPETKDASESLPADRSLR